MRTAAAILALVLGLSALPAGADQVIDTYRTWIGPADLVNSRGVRLDTAAGILRQDRANFHRFGRPDPGDQGDRYFGSVENRRLMEQYLLAGGIAAADAARIVAGSVFVTVEIRGKGGVGRAVRVHVE